MEGVWSEQDTTPSHIEAGLRELLKQRHADDGGYVPARVLNLVVILDREWRGEIENRLERVGRYHPSRTVMIAVEPRRERLDAWAFMVCEGDASPGSLSVCHEHVVVEVGPRHLRHLDTIVDPLVVSDLSTVVWAPHGHREAVQALRRLAQVVLVDSQDEPDPHLALDRSQQLAQHAYVVDLAWLRSTPWRERIAASFDPPKWREDLRRISAVTVRCREDSTAAGLLLLGWLAARLGWRPEKLAAGGGKVRGRVRASRGEVALELDPEARMNVPGLAGITIRTESGVSLSLDRATGGLSATHRDRRGQESRWTVLGASRGEAGILGEGIRQALLREPTYQPALAAADAMAP
ncbi:MAG TPA: glucose-6-phosphate dehydrogenase assembly protein OpcA [Solirubrobacteraceae bacterium]|nr:glucose-6-phosphate dehydrogenase assembly protein OpcA [Solirubrobacteraceae bacterium]